MTSNEDVLLGFIDEPITDYFTNKIDYTTNKLGGFPDWMIGCDIRKKITCKLCGSVVPLLLQIYAPIKERIQYHRTLYIFACINPSCWGNADSWMCIKNQTLIKEKLFFNTSFTCSNDDWCNDANNWEYDNQNYKNLNEASLSLDNRAASMINKVSILEEENANEVSGDAFVDFKGIVPTAEIEPDENEPITVDSPVIPNCNLLSLLQKKPSAVNVCDEHTHFVPFFIYAMKEKREKDPLLDHVQSLLTEYSRTTGDKNCIKFANNVNVAQQSDEKYEKSHPLHGDKLFHTFLSRIKTNSDQILRYCRNEAAPLFLYPESSDIPTKCEYCKGDMIFETQILSTVINYLKLSNHNVRHTKECLDFGSAFIYTCKESCDKSVEKEYVVIQCEKL